MIEADHIAFDELDDADGVEIIDRLEQFRYRFHTPDSVSPTRERADAFQFPISQAISINTTEISFPSVVTLNVRTGDGEMVTDVGHLDQCSLEAGSYILEINETVKTYMWFDGAVDISSSLTEVRLDFHERTTVRIGARSLHKRPAETITTTDDPVDMMAAISTFGGALKTTSPERAYPTLRGHPPAVELGDTLEIPESVETADTGVRIEIPPTYAAIYVVAPLAYYLGAELAVGPSPRLVTDDGFEYSLESASSLEQTVERTLKQVFLLDCITRTEGFHVVDLRERSDVEAAVDLDWERLYDAPIAERLATYLDIDYSVVEEHVPKWRLSVTVSPTEETVELLPFVVDDLAVVRVPEADGITAATDEGVTDGGSRDAGYVRSAADSADWDPPSYVTPEETDAIEQGWIGEEVPVGASKLTMDAFQNRLERDPTQGDLSITVVSNDERMKEEEDLVDRIYGGRSNLPFDVEIERDLTVAELQSQFQQDSSFLHYIGHTTPDGFECTDGKLDAGTLTDVGIDSFLLNSCNSYEQGLHLIEAGAIGGVVTLNDVLNDAAIQMGESVASLLNAGFPLRGALTIARKESVFGGQYIVVGDGGTTIAQPESQVPTLVAVEPVNDGYRLDIQTYPTDHVGLGGLYIPFLDGIDEYFLCSGKIGSFQVSREELIEFVTLENMPIRYDGEVYWSSPCDLDDIL